jgi:hypothetical protein
MTNQEDYTERVADLVATAFDTMGEALAKPAGVARNGLTAKAQLQMEAAQAVATLAHARETRILALATLAGLDPVKVDQAGDLPREAYLAAAYALGLVDEGDQVDVEALKRQLTGDHDPADADLGDLK